ncbi:hypothetical protein C4573_04110 [Candidatus Woesearchaeota archaeon]|nr:MAG: hypothetical protein C4573_04110 [Candidatus Woesearchaeota archaeon]
MKAKLGLYAVLTIVLVVFGLSISFQTNVSIQNTTTSNYIVCTWNATADATQINVTWYNNTAQYKNESLAGTATNSLIDPLIHKKGETWNCTVTLWNGSVAVTQSAQTVIKNAGPDDLSIINATGSDIGNQTNVSEDTAYTFTVNTTDDDGDGISYGILASTLPSGASIDDVTGIFSWTPTQAQNGSNNVTFQATDDDGTDPITRNKKVNFFVVEVNDNPYFNPALQSQNATEGTNFTYSITAADEESNYPISFALTVNPANSYIIIANTSNTTAQITFNRTGNAPVFSDVGAWTVTVNITDTQNGSNSSSFTLTVSTINHAPNLTFIDNQTGTQGQPFYFYINATDQDNNTLNFSINVSYYNITLIETNGSNASAIINVTNLTNDHVVNRYVNITVTDGSLTDSQEVFLNITNTNDAPIIYNISQYATNTLPSINSNMKNLTAYTGIAFSYRVNGTDPDMLTYAGDNITFSSNNSNFDINTTSGIINFTKNESSVGTYAILITVTDLAGLNYSELVNLTIINNTVPYFNHTISNITCYEDAVCYYDFNGTDNDPNDSVSYEDNSSLFSIHAVSGIVNFTPLQAVVQESPYDILITLNDTRGASNSSIWYLQINNTNDVPVLDSFTLPLMVVNHSVYLQINATDEDEDLPLALQYDSLAFSSYNVTPTVVFNISPTGLINFTPNTSHVGNHSYNITVADTQGAYASVVVNFTVYNQTIAPNITDIYPYGAPLSAITVFAWSNTSNFPNMNTLINASENMNITFNHSTTDDTAAANLTYQWYYDDIQITNSSLLLESNHTLQYYFNYASSGNRRIKLTVFDDRYENSSFTWNVTVNNTNRAPVLYNYLTNLSVDQTSTFNNYFSFYDSQTKFLDPDDDVNGNGILDSNETSSLTITVYPSCTKATLAVSGNHLTVTPEEVGMCLIYANATDGEFVTTSALTMINITNVPEQETQTTSSSGGGGSSTQTVTVPIPEEVEIPKPLEIVAASVITFYENNTIIIPITLVNNWKDALTGINLTAHFNASNITYTFAKGYFDTIALNGTEKTTLEVSNYRLGENFEIRIEGNVTTPKFSDSATIYINSLEQSSQGQEIKTKVTFARDLLDNNPECQELNEILEQSLIAIEQAQYNRATTLIDGVIQGCKYLIEEKKQKETQQPKDWKSYLSFYTWPSYIAMFIGAFFIGLIVISIFSRSRKKKAKEQAEEKKIQY